MRVYDFAMRANVPPTEKAVVGLKELTASATVVHAQHVWDWFTVQREALAEGADVLRMIDRCVPPFLCTMVEYRDHRDGGHVGVVVYRDISDSGYTVHASMWFSDLQSTIAALPGFASVNVSPDGAPDWDSYRIGFEDGVSEENQKHGRGMMAESFAAALLTFRFMHARGVEMRDTEPSRGDRRRAMKEGKPAPVTYKTLEIGAMTRTLATEGNITQNGITKALHLCRGHFADYTKGAGLFGKYKVEVFVPEHVKGRRQKGVIVKDYAVGDSLTEPTL